MRSLVGRSLLPIALFTFASSVPARAQVDPGLERLREEIARLEPMSGGTVGVAAIHLQSGREIYFKGDERFPMASTYKVPIAVQLLSRVEAGEISLRDMIELTPEDLHPGSGTLSELFDDPGVILSLHNLLELMLLISDNSATDLVLAVAGGSEAVNGRMERLGIEGITVSRPTVGLIGEYYGIQDLPPDGKITREQFRERVAELKPSDRVGGRRNFSEDLQDTSTPRGMAALLSQIWRGEALSEEHTELLLDIMRRSTTGRARIKGYLPPGTEVSHKTGTIGPTTNDVGIVTLPGEAGDIVTVVFIKDSDQDSEDRERAIAHIARAIYDFFVFNPS